MLQYSITIKWSDEDEGFIARVPELQGLNAFGKTPEQAIKKLNSTARAFIDTLVELGEPIPSPDKELTHSGQLRIRIPKTLHSKLANSAQNDGVSLNTYIVSLLSEKEGKHEIINELRNGVIGNIFEPTYFGVPKRPTDYYSLSQASEEPFTAIPIYPKRRYAQ